MIHISEIFDISSGSNLNLNNLILENNIDSIPYVSRSRKNNGVVAYVKKDSNYKLNKKNTISIVLVGDNVMKAFFHKYEYYTSQNMVILTPKQHLSEYELIYYCKCIELNSKKYSYGRIPKSNLNDVYIPKSVPLYIKKQKIPIIKINDFKQFSLSLSSIKITSLFDIITPKQKVVINTLSKGTTPVVSATEYSNGISIYANLKPEFNFQCLTLSKNGSVGEVFYQEQPFSATSDILVLKPKFEMNETIAIFIATILKLYFKKKFYYGRKITISKIKGIEVFLPLENGSIDVFKIKNYMIEMSMEYYSIFDKTTNLDKFIII